MPKERKDRSVSADKLRASPYRCSTSHLKGSLNKNPSESEEKEWEDARCPVCMEHPHNAILLLCSSHDKGCRPFMCDTSYRHSNCFDQFKKPLSNKISASMTEESQPSVTLSGLRSSILEPSQTAENVVKEKSKLSCPLCRGEVNGMVVVDAARSFMNTKSRSCANEKCDFSGTYADLRKHARTVHPFARPSEADPERQRDWYQMERERDVGDLLSSLGGSSHTFRVRFIVITNSRLSSLSSSLSGDSPATAELTFRMSRSRPHLFGESYDDESRDDDNESSDGVESGPAPSRNFFRR